MAFLGVIVILSVMAACAKDTSRSGGDDIFLERRLKMVSNQIESRGVKDKAVLEAMRRVPRHLFVPENYRGSAYEDEPLPIGYGQTISQPYIVALMTELCEVDKSSKVLEIGTGSGYQAAVLAELCDSVSSIEIVPELGRRADSTLKALGYRVDVRIGDGYRGWPEKAPFDAIIVTAAPDEVPQPLIDQLAEGGRLVIPVGTYHQDLKQIKKVRGKLIERSVIPVRFVPMTGEAQK